MTKRFITKLALLGMTSTLALGALPGAALAQDQDEAAEHTDHHRFEEGGGHHDRPLDLVLVAVGYLL